ncbi:MAG: LegC family aminotransferase [Candidatus Omnitrophica bacterium]|nr:LegC family aminotransferase [Candidatus Omnitrophota bacterium]
MSKRNIFLDAPNVGNIEKRYLCRAIDSGYISTFGDYVPKFEKKFASYLGIKKAVSTQSGTSAIHIALYTLGIGKGDEVIVPSLTFIATVNPIKYVGATPVFVDVDMDTWNILPSEIEKKITKHTKAILPVHLYGNPCDMSAINKIAKEYNIKVIEDATESLGATYNGKYTGTMGDLGCFSFNGNKIITTGGGGMVVGNDDKMLDRIRFLVNQAREDNNNYYHPEIGFNYRMTNIEAALGLSQLERLEEFLEKKIKFNTIYKEELSNIKGIKFQNTLPKARSSCWLTCILIEKDLDISTLQRKLEKKGIPTRRVFMPVVEFPPYCNYRSDKYKNSYTIYRKGLCLPSSTLNSFKDIVYVCKNLRELLK